MEILFRLWLLIDVRKNMDLMEAKAKLANENCKPGEYREVILLYIVHFIYMCVCIYE